MSLFQLRTASAYKECHLLYCNRRMRDREDEGEFSAVVEVRVNYGDKEPYTFKTCVMQYGDRFEVINRQEYDRRRRTAEEYGDEYVAEQQNVRIAWGADDVACEAEAICLEAIKKFKALIELDIMSLPVTW